MDIMANYFLMVSNEGKSRVGMNVRQSLIPMIFGSIQQKKAATSAALTHFSVVHSKDLVSIHLLHLDGFVEVS